MHEAIRPNSKRTAKDMFSLVQEQQAGELPVKAFCALKNISEASYFYWRKKYMNQAKPANEPQAQNFSLLQMHDDEQKDAVLFAEYKGLKLYREVQVSYLKELMR
jgi:hypothetical protein